MRETIREKYYDLVDDITASYNKVKVVDDFDYYESNPYTIFYLNKNESFEKFEDLWKTCLNNESSFDDVLYDFTEKATQNFDFIELGTLDTYTDSEYELKF